MRYRWHGILIVLFMLFVQSIFAQNYNDYGPIWGIRSLASTDGYGSGISTFDFNNDGWDDLSMTFDNDTQRIYINNQGVLELSDISLYIPGEIKSFLWVDYDNDNDNDLYITRQYGSNLLLQNDGNFQFTDVTVAAGLSTAFVRHYGASFGDYDLDGDLDLFVCKYVASGDSTLLENQNNLYRNNGDGTFTDVTFSAGVSHRLSPSFQSVWVDRDGDRYPEIFVINDRFIWFNEYYHNNTDGTFTSIADSVGVEMPNSEPMSLSPCDYDNDGDIDFFCSDGALPTNPRGSLFTQNSNLTFTDEASNVGIGVGANMWGATWLDYNNDGYSDLYIATDVPVSKNDFFSGSSQGTFVRDTAIFNGNYDSQSFCSATGDFNHDGFADIVSTNGISQFAFLWLSDGTGTNNFVRFSLEGTFSNSHAIGTWIKVYAGNTVQTKFTVCGENYIGQNSQNYLFGVGNATQIDSIQLLFPSGILNTHYNLAVNQSYHFVEQQNVTTFDLDVVGSNPFCEGDSAVLTAPVLDSYTWNTGDSSRSIVVFDSGVYSVTGVDSNGMLYESLPLMVEQVPEPTISSEISAITCFNGSDGSIVLDVQNQNQPYTITWSNGSIGDSLSSLSAGLYSYTYLDTFSCSYTDTFNLTSPFEINVQVQVSPATIDSLGSLQLLPNGGVAPYTMILDGDTLGSMITYVDSGTYLLIIIDALGCIYEENISIPFFNDVSTSIGQNTLSTEPIQVYPNPTGSWLNIKTADPLMRIKCYNYCGKLLFETQNDRIDLTTYPSGLYYLQVQTSAGVYQVAASKSHR